MRALRCLDAHQHELALLLGEPRLEDRDLIAPGSRNAEIGRLAIEEESLDGIARHAQAIELAPAERLDRARFFCRGLLRERIDIVSGHALFSDMADRLCDAWGRRWRWRERWRRLLGNLAGRVGAWRGEAAIGAVEIIVLGMRKLGGGRGQGRGGNDPSKNKAKSERARHGGHFNAASIARFLTLGTALALGACGEYQSLSAMSADEKIDWQAKLQQYSEPGPLGTFFNRRPPAISIRASGPYPGPLSEPVPPLIAPEIADAVVAAPLRVALNPDARMNLAAASMLAATAATGTAVAWKAADAGGTVVPARDVYLSHHGLVCRDLQQQLQKSDHSQAEQITLCRADLGDGHVLWLPGSPD